MGIEPTSSAWEAEVLPLNHTRRVTLPTKLARERFRWGSIAQRVALVTPLCGNSSELVSKVAHSGVTPLCGNSSELVSEVTHPGEDHGDVMLIGGGDHLFIPH